MRHIIFEQATQYPVALLIKASSFKQQELVTNYVQPLNKLGIPTKNMIAFTLETDNKKVSVSYAKTYLDQLLPILHSMGVKYLYVAEPTYFKLLAKVTKADPHYGYCLPCKIQGYEDLKIILGLNYQALIFNPALISQLNLSLTTLASVVGNTYSALGTGIIHSAQYPESLQDIAQALNSLHQYEHLTCDIETFSLRFNEAGIATIAFAWDQHNGIAFACDYTKLIQIKNDDLLGFKQSNSAVRNLIKDFFKTYKGTITWHNTTFDIKILIFTLWMQDALDTEGLLLGLDTLTHKFHDTKIIAYLATNSTAGNILGLKSLAHEFAGNWAVDDIKDVRLISLKQLLRYNLVDALSTWYVFNKHYPVMILDKQKELYKSLMLPSLKLIIQMELTGMPMCPYTIRGVKQKLEADKDKYLDLFNNNKLIQMFNLLIQTSAMDAANAKLKKKQHPLSYFEDIFFNPNSGQQLQRLLYEQMGLPIIDLTDKKQPSTAADTIEKLINHTNEPVYKELLETIIAYGKVTKILSTFIPAFERGIYKKDKMQYLHGSFNLGGTVSGRLSSSEP